MTDKNKKDNGPVIENKYSYPSTDNNFLLSLPTLSESKLNKNSEAKGDIDGDLTDDASREWGLRLAESLLYYNKGVGGGTDEPLYSETINNKQMRQSLEHNGEDIRIRTPQWKKGSGGIITGDTAIYRLMESRHTGGIHSVPLYHSGFWIDLRPLSDSELIDLSSLIQSDEIQLGRESNGLIFSDRSIYLINRICNAILSTVVSTSVSVETNSDLKKHIKIQDIPVLLWGAACCLYPRGFNYKRACMTIETDCRYVAEELINLTKLLWVDKSEFTDEQKSHMLRGKKRGSMTVESVIEYQNKLLSNDDMVEEVVPDNDGGAGIKVKFTSPSLEDFAVAGYRWVDEIVESVESVIDVNTSLEDKNSMIQRKAQATHLNQYSHWVKSIIFKSEDGVPYTIEDEETVSKILKTQSQDNEFYNNFMSCLNDYINTSTVSMVGIPEYECPKCGEDQDSVSDLPKFTSLIPIDVAQVFFSILSQRLNNIILRN